MKTISRIAIGAAVVLMVAAMLQPAHAACGTARLLNNVGAYLVSNPNWGSAGAPVQTCAGAFGCYASESLGGPISPDIAGVFWGFDTVAGASASDPAVGAGVDNGSWDVSNWSKSRSADFGEIYYYPGWLTLDVAAEYNYVAGNPPNWSFPVDACITDVVVPGQIDVEECTCILVTDQWDGVGYFMADSALSDVGGDFLYEFQTLDFQGIGSMQMLATPAPQVLSSSRDLATADVTMTVAVDDITGMGADYRDAGCDCALGFLVYQQVVGRGVVPADRAIGSGWTAALNATGGAQAVNPFGAGTAQADILVPCDAALDQDIYLSTVIVEAGGLVGGNVSGNSFRVECGANLAEPEREDRGRGRSADAPRGRDNNRGRGQRDK